MEVINCKGCGKMFNYLGGQPLCPECIKQLDVKFNEVKEYVYDHPRCSINEVSEEMEVSVSQIKKWIREEKLSFSDESQVGLSCEGCGKMIRTGRFCDVCKTSMANNLGSLYQKPEVTVKKERDGKQPPKMRFLDN